ncbi:retrovirus-related Pol polyprotein from transposon TNT 1-94 [Trichonephila clavipes]|nr:retrovirus-related Pol polyprotein from transposon TNT 1-94 [Trichonephila clavipes]
MVGVSRRPHTGNLERRLNLCKISINKVASEIQSITKSDGRRGLRVVKIEAELILEANRLQLMKQDLEKAENAYLSSFTLKKSKTLPGATAAAHGDQMARMIYQKKGGKFQRQVRETPSTSEKPGVSSDNHNLIPCTEAKWIRTIGRKVTGPNVYYSIEGEATRFKSFNEIERYWIFRFVRQEALMVEVTIPNCYKQAIRSETHLNGMMQWIKKLTISVCLWKWTHIQVDITNAYLYANLDAVIYMKQPAGYEIDNNKVYSDFATNRDDRVSMGGFITFIDETPISWQTFKQKSVSLSTMEAGMLV